MFVICFLLSVAKILSIPILNSFQKGVKAGRSVSPRRLPPGRRGNAANDRKVITKTTLTVVAPICGARVRVVAELCLFGGYQLVVPAVPTLALVAAADVAIVAVTVRRTGGPLGRSVGIRGIGHISRSCRGTRRATDVQQPHHNEKSPHIPPQKTQALCLFHIRLS